MSAEITIDATSYGTILASILIAAIGGQAIALVRAWNDLSETKRKSDEDRAKIAKLESQVAVLIDRFERLPRHAQLDTSSASVGKFHNGNTESKPSLATESQPEKSTT